MPSQLRQIRSKSWRCFTIRASGTSSSRCRLRTRASAKQRGLLVIPIASLARTLWPLRIRTRIKPGTSHWCPEFGNYIGLPGGSPDDWEGFNSLQHNPVYQAAGWNDLEYWVMNGDFVHVMEPGKAQGSELKPGTTRFSWNSSSCKW